MANGQWQILRQTLMFIGSIGLLVVFAEKASAAGFSVSVDPPLTYIEALPSVKVETPIAIANLAESPVTLTILLKSFTTRNEFGQVEIKNEPLPIASLIKIIDKGRPVEEIILAPGELREVTLAIDVQDSLSSKDYSFSIIFQAKHDLFPEGLVGNKKDKEAVLAFSRLLPAVATNVILSVGPWEAGKLDVEFASKTFYESGPVDFTVRITNNTKRTAQVEGEILIQNLFGQTIGKIDLAPSHVLAESSRRYQKVIWDEPVLVGPYLATLQLNTSQGLPADAAHQALQAGDSVSLKQIRFFAAPRRVLIGSFIFLLVGLWITSRIKKRLDFPR